MFHTNKKQSLCTEHCKFSEFLSSSNRFSHFAITVLAAVIPSVIPALSNPFKINLNITQLQGYVNTRGQYTTC